MHGVKNICHQFIIGPLYTKCNENVVDTDKCSY